MDNVHAYDLPRFLDPLLDYLANHLPPSIYSVLFTALSYGIILLSRLSAVITALPSLKPWEWDAQTVLPPLILFLTAYYTLVSLYRTTSFMVRMVFRVVKWGLILGLLGAGAGWFAGMDNGYNNNDNGVGGVLGAFREGLYARDQEELGASRASRSRTRTPNPRPRMYESFTAHEQWRYDEEEARRADSVSDAQRFIESVAGLAGRAVGGLGNDLLSNAKYLFDNIAEPAASSSRDTNEQGSASRKGQTRKQPNRKTKAFVRRKTASR